MYFTFLDNYTLFANIYVTTNMLILKQFILVLCVEVYIEDDMCKRNYIRLRVKYLL
jgi:hypothetical protein